jgi:hypothetical protein
MGKPFSRALAVLSAINAMIAANPGIPLQGIAGLPSYTSRGKGRGTPSRNWFRGSPSRYMPHQGAQEIARRAARMAV